MRNCRILFPSAEFLYLTTEMSELLCKDSEIQNSPGKSDLGFGCFLVSGKRGLQSLQGGQHNSIAARPTVFGVQYFIAYFEI